MHPCIFFFNKDASKSVRIFFLSIEWDSRGMSQHLLQRLMQMRSVEAGTIHISYQLVWEIVLRSLEY